MKLMIKIIPKVLSLTAIANDMVEMARGAVRLEFLDVPQRARGIVGFDDEIEEKQSRHMNSSLLRSFLLFGAATAVVAAIWIFNQRLNT